MAAIDAVLNRYADLKTERENITSQLLDFTKGKAGSISVEDREMLRSLMKRDKELSDETRALINSDELKSYRGGA